MATKVTVIPLLWRMEARIDRESATGSHGDRVYTCTDLEAHIWTVAQTVRTVSREEAEAALGGGAKITGWL